MRPETHAVASWWARPRAADSAAWIANYQQSLQARHRTALVDAVTALQPETLLEVGCHCGPNLMRLAAACPDLQMIGVDVNAEAIAAGRRWVAEAGLSARIQLNVGRIPDALAPLPSGGFDVVLSCYALAYLAPLDLDAVLYELGRLSTRAVVLAEPMAQPGDMTAPTRSRTGYHEWAHDYRAASRWITSWRGRAVTITPVDPPVDRLNGILVAACDGFPILNTP